MRPSFRRWLKGSFGNPTSYSIWPPFLVDPIAYRTEAMLGVAVSDSSVNCIEQTTEWSACSKSCGMGFSTRVTNRNPQCEMVKQTRLCMVRPCEQEHKQPADKVGAWRQPPIPEEGALPHGRPGSKKSLWHSQTQRSALAGSEPQRKGREVPVMREFTFFFFSLSLSLSHVLKNPKQLTAGAQVEGRAGHSNSVPSWAGLANLIPFLEKHWLLSHQAQFILKRSLLTSVLGSICRKHRVEVVSSSLNPRSPTSYPVPIVRLINNCWWINEWLSGNYFHDLKESSGTSTFASTRRYVPNKIAHFFPFSLDVNQLSVSTLTIRHADQKLWLVPDDITGLVTGALDQINAIRKLNHCMEICTNLRPRSCLTMEDLHISPLRQ